jgi:hypothetical protein
MRLFGRAFRSATSRAVAALAAVVLLPAFLAACASSGEGGSHNFLKFLNSGNDQPDSVTQDYLNQSTYCPPIQVRGGTETLSFYEKGHDGDPAYVKYLASVGKTARECHNSGPNYSIKIGVAGRVVAGPKGGPGSLVVPLRIAIVKQFGATLYSELYKIPVTLAAPDFAADFSQVVEQVALQIGPADHDLLIYVGFDDGKPAKKPAEIPPTG